MTFTYDPKLNVAYILIAEQDGEVADSHEFENGNVIVDLDATGKFYGIELLNAREQLKMSNGKFQFINSLTKETHEALLPVP